jgi:hypothetical protein
MIQQQPNDPTNPKPTDIASSPSPENLPEHTGPSSRRRPLPDDDLFVSRLSPAARSVLVIVCGVLTSAASLLGVFLLNVVANENIMGLYANYVIPAGALIVGLLASSGYALAAWFSGRRISGALLLTILGLQVLAYFAAQYIEFLGHGSLRSTSGSGKMGFFEYFDLLTQNFAWKKTAGTGAGDPLGKLGYLLRLGEILGFSLGALLIPLALWSVPYCELCERYMKTRKLAVLPAETQASEEVTRLAGAKDVDGFSRCIQGHQANAKANGKLLGRITVTLTHCRQCSGGRLQLMLEEGSGQQARFRVLGVVPLDPEFVRDVVAARLA